MIKWMLYRKVEGPRYMWFFVRDWVKLTGLAWLFRLKTIAEVKVKR